MKWIKRIELTAERKAKLKSDWENCPDGSMIEIANSAELKFFDGLERKLLTPDEHNKQYIERWRQTRQSAPTGIVCPKCRAEMIIKDNVVMMSYPPKQNIVCPICGEVATVYCRE